MNTTDYFQAVQSLNEDQIHPEFHTYATVWMKSRMPERYQELKAAFKTYENEIYAAQQEEGLPF